MRNVRRRQAEKFGRRRHLIILTFMVLICIYVSVKIIAGDSGFVKYMDLRSARDQLLAETGAVKKQNEDMRKHLEILEKEPDRIEEMAREYGLTKEGEWVYKFDKQQ